MKKESG